MTRQLQAFCALAALALCAAAPCSASPRSDLFDGAAKADDGGSWPGLPALRESAAGSAALQGAPVQPAGAARSNADLYYFTPEEAAQAARKAAAAPKTLEAGYRFASDVPEDIRKQTEEDLSFIGSIQGKDASRLHRKIFGAVDGAAYMEFFKSRVKLIGMSGCGDSNAVACVIPMFGHSNMWLTQNYIKFSHPQIARMMVVFHEARHTELLHLFWSHAKCPTPFKDAQGRDMRSIWTGAPLAGEPACDTTPKGSYGSSAIMLKNIQKFCANCTDKVRMDAGLYADDQLGRITDAGAREQILEDLYR